MFDDLPSALDALEARCREAAGGRRHAVKAGVRDYAPAQQVQARAELAGPRRVRAGVDVRGDGSAVPFTGRVRRREIQRLRDESAYDALRRTVAE